MSQQYSLRWNNHQPNFISMFTTLLNTQTLVDVTLAAEGKHLQAHKVVLSACSTYFQALFVDNPSRHPIVILKDVSFADLRTMVDFMYYGEVNVTEEQLPQVLDTAKLLKIKGLTEMPDSTSLTRSQGTSADFQPGDSVDSHRHSASPATSPSNKRKRFVRRKSSTGSTSLNMVSEDIRPEDGPPTVDLVRETITLSSVPQQRRREFEERAMENHQTAESHNMNVEALAMDANPAGIPQGGQWSMMEHAYPRYSNACTLQPDQGLYNMNNVMHPHLDADISEYGQALGVPGPSPGPSCVAEAQTPQEPPPQPPKRRRTTNPQSEENFQRALEAVRFGGIGFCKAARMFGVNNRTLWLEYKKKGYPNNRPSIKSRIKREHTTPPPEHKDDIPQPEQQMALLCPPHQVPSIESQHDDEREAFGGHHGPQDQQAISYNSVEGVVTCPECVVCIEGGLRVRRTKLFKRQNRVPEEREVRRQASEPAPATSAPSAPPLLKHESYPQYPSKNRRSRTQEEGVGSLLIRAVTVIERQPSTSSEAAPPDAPAHRASHTPAVRAGPPLSCNFCWNTVDECGRILRRKTQYHCPECRTNLCIVPCFHEYHDGPDSDPSAR